MSDRHPASQAFHDHCDAMKLLHDQKQKDYGRENDPFANVRGTEEWGQPGWVGAMIRATDKMRRLQKVAQGGTLANEGVEDSFMDLAVYAIIGLVLYREQAEKKLIENFYNEVEKVCAPETAVRRGPAPFPLTEADRTAGEQLLQMRAVPRGRFVPQDNGEVWWVPNTEQKPKRWDLPEEAQ
jgi:hypothetical protein